MTNDFDDNVFVINTLSNAVVATVTVGTVPAGVAIALIPQILHNLKGRQKKNDCGLIFERFNQLTWESTPFAAGYFVYRNGTKIATLSASTLEYEDHNRKKGVTTVYTVTAFDAMGDAVASATITIK